MSFNFESYYLNNDEYFRDEGTSYDEFRNKKYKTLEDQLVLVEYKINVLTKYTYGVDDDTDFAILEEYQKLIKERGRLHKLIRIRDGEWCK